MYWKWLCSLFNKHKYNKGDIINSDSTYYCVRYICVRCNNVKNEYPTRLSYDSSCVGRARPFTL